MTTRPFLIGTLLLVIPVVALLAAPRKKGGPAESPSSTPAPAASTPAPAAATATSRLRIWKGDFPSKRTVRLTLRPAGKGADLVELGNLEPVSRFSDYVDAPSGECTVEAHVAGDAGAPLATFASHLAAGASSTLILRETAAGALLFEMIDDRPTGDDASAELVVRNFVAGLQTLELDAGPDLHSRLVTPGCYLHLRGLPRAPLEVKTTADDGTGTKNEWSSEVDLREIRRATLVIVTDPYGRIRPRIIVDGMGGKEEPGAK